MSDDDIVIGLKKLGPITIQGSFVDYSPPNCKAVPCSVCGGCSVCKDFHGNAYGACTDETCPLKKVKRMEGTIATLVSDKGFGFIKVEGRKKDVFFHKSGLKNIKYDELTVGQAVEFEIEDGEKGPRAEDIYV